MRKPNYRFERAERDRAKKARSDKKLQRQQERSAPRAEDDAPELTAGNEPPAVEGKSGTGDKPPA